MTKTLGGLCAFALTAACGLGAWGDTVPFKVGKFAQEVAVHVGEPAPGVPGKFKGIAHDGDAIYTLTDQGIFFAEVLGDPPVKVPGSESIPWACIGACGERPLAASKGKVYVLHPDRVTQLFDVGDVAITHVLGDGKQVLVGTTSGVFLNFYGGKQIAEYTAIGQVHQLTLDYVVGSGGVAKVEAGAIVPLSIRDKAGRDWGTSDIRAVAKSGDVVWLASTAGLIRGEDGAWQFFEGKDGLPYADFTCAATGPEGEIWLGTKIGAIRYDGKAWAYRQGKRWLPGDEVRAITVDDKGNATFLTDKGVGRIERQMMTLAEKAAFYEQEIEQYIMRTEYGYTSEVNLKNPGDKSEISYEDSDNDGLWTSMYGASQAFAYGARKSPEAKARATKAFEALRFLQKVHEGAEIAPPKGYVARTIRSTADPDPNIGRVEGDRETKATEDKAWKVYEPRWPKSKDGKWFYKTDTSSDELDGHYFFYALYYDLVAETPDEKSRVQDVVRALTDHFIEHDFSLVDIDGTVTRWGAFGPEDLNGKELWWAERGLNSLSMLSYLAVAEHVTGDAKYAKAARELIDKHYYLQNLTFPKLQWGPGTGNHSDDEMAFMSFYNLLRYTKDPVVKNTTLFAFFRYFVGEFPEVNPLFNFAYAALGLNQEITDNWGTWPVSPPDGWLTDSMDSLFGFTLDRCNWAHKNSHRIDLIFPFGSTEEPYAPDSGPKGYRVNGKCLPVGERFFHHWNTNPWTLDYGGNGRSLASGTVYLLPYFMGVYHGFIEESAE